MIRSTFAFIALAFLTASAPQGDPQEPVFKSLKRELRSGFQSFTDAEIRAAIQPVDIEGDSLQDWQVDFEPFGSAWCGTGGCRYQLWRGTKGGKAVRVFDRQVRGRTVVRRDGQTVFVFDFHGSQCGGFGSELCPGEFAWDGRRARMALLPTPGRHTSDGNPFGWRW